jgi:hypothetical protein
MTYVDAVIVGVMIALNSWWAFENWRKEREHANEHMANISEIARIKNAALALFRAAERTSVDVEHKVCSVCKRIVAVHTTDDTGATVCVNCEKDRVNGFANGVAING